MPRRAQEPPPRHLAEGARPWWHAYFTEWKWVLVVVVSSFGWVTVEMGWRPWVAVGVAVVMLLPIPVFLLRRVPPEGRERGDG